LINASPDLRQQIADTPALHPRSGIRSTPIEAVILTGAEIDQMLGLLLLREATPFSTYARSDTHGLIVANPVFEAMQHMERRAVQMDQPFSPTPAMTAELFPVPGKVPLYLESPQSAESIATESTAGVEIQHDGARVIVVPGAAAITDAMLTRFARADVLLFDGTVFHDDEMLRLGASDKTGSRMGHMPINGVDGSLCGLERVGARRIYFHINNTNPIHIDASPEYAYVRNAGWEIARDGMEIVL
jgi:pyrroloquinoline quinone biosynthesis protein B